MSVICTSWKLQALLAKKSGGYSALITFQAKIKMKMAGFFGRFFNFFVALISSLAINTERAILPDLFDHARSIAIEIQNAVEEVPWFCQFFLFAARSPKKLFYWIPDIVTMLMHTPKEAYNQQIFVTRGSFFARQKVAKNSFFSKAQAFPCVLLCI